MARLEPRLMAARWDPDGGSGATAGFRKPQISDSELVATSDTVDSQTSLVMFHRENGGSLHLIYFESCSLLDPMRQHVLSNLRWSPTLEISGP